MGASENIYETFLGDYIPTFAISTVGTALTLLDIQESYVQGKIKLVNSVTFLIFAAVGGVFAHLVQGGLEVSAASARVFNVLTNLQSVALGILPSPVMRMKNWTAAAPFAGFRLGYTFMATLRHYQYYKRNESIT